jgi:hypothetical protein
MMFLNQNRRFVIDYSIMGYNRCYELMAISIRQQESLDQP